jgi:CRISPR-associated endonuclease/helicase Cas3
MIVVFVSECCKKSLLKTRKILDSYADRIGSTTWKTNITQDGLDAIHESLKNIASKNCAISCWLVKNKTMELEWTVGSNKNFNEDGKIPVSILSV